MSQTPSVPAVGPPQKETAIKIISHTTLFYWWPVWFVGFVMAGVTWMGGHRMAVVPVGTEAVASRQVEGFAQPRDVLVVPPDRRLPQEDGVPVQPTILMATSKNLGGIFVLVLLVVILVTNVPLRGLWSALAILFLVAASLMFALMDWWDPILRFLGLLHIHMNAFGYVAIAGCLFFAWVVTTFLFDRRIYMTFTPGQFRVHQEIGAGETAFDTYGMMIRKRRNDLFRHWILGFGSGDLMVQTGGANPQTFEIPNVLFIGRKVKRIEEMLQERQVVSPPREAVPVG